MDSTRTAVVRLTKKNQTSTNNYQLKAKELNSGGGDSCSVI